MKIVRQLKHIYIQHKNLRQQLLSNFLFSIDPEEKNREGRRINIHFNIFMHKQLQK